MANAEIIVKIVDQTRGGMSSVKDNLDGVNKSAKDTNTSFLNLNRAVGAFAAALSVGAITQFGSEIQNINNRIALLPKSLGNASDNFERILNIANDTQQPLAATADLYQKIARSADQYGLSAQNVGTVTETFANLLRLAGADAAAADGAIRQLGQALGSGALRGDEFNSIVEATAGEILPLLARELGVSEGQVRKLASEGKITGDVLINALGKSAEDVGGRVGKMSVTIGGAITTLQNNLLAFGQQATPLFEGIAEGILLLAENLDVAVVAAGSFIAALAVGKLAAVITGLGGITTAFTALTTAMKANPVVLFASLAATAITGLYVYWDELGFYVENAFTYIELGARKFLDGFVKMMEDSINGVYDGWVSFQDNVVAIFAGIGAAIMDPLDAVDAFNDAMTKSLAESTSQATEKLVDFSGTLVTNRERITELEKKLQDSRRALDENKNSVEKNTESATSNFKAVELQVKYFKDLDEIYGIAGGKLNAFNADLEQQIQLARLDTNEKAQQVAAYKAVEAAMADAEKAGKKLTAQQVKDIETRTKARVAELQKIEEEEKRKKELIEDRTDFIEESEKLIREMTRETMNEVQKIEDEKQEYLKEARRLGLEDHKSTQDAIIAYDEKIKREQILLEEELAKKRKQAIDDTVSEYSSLYGFLGDKLEELTGISSKEFGLIRDVVKITFGTDIQQIMNEVFANGVGAVSGFGKTTTDTMKDVSTVTNTEMKATEGGITAMLSTSLDNMGSFVKAVFNNFATLGGGIIEILGMAFDWLTGGFASILDGLGGFITGFFSSVTSMIGGVQEVPFLAKGGSIPSGGMAVVGEEGPEIVTGPARVTSTADSAEILSGGGNYTVNFNISTVDAMGFDELLTTRRDVLVDLMRTATTERPNRQLRGVY